MYLLASCMPLVHCNNLIVLNFIIWLLGFSVFLIHLCYLNWQLQVDEEDDSALSKVLSQCYTAIEKWEIH